MGLLDRIRKRERVVGTLLEGCRPGRLQSVGLMQVVPLVAEDERDDFASPAEALVSTTSYGTLAFDNRDARPLLVPCHAGYVVARAAQDHAMPQVAIVEGRSEEAFATAMCIQSTQGGLIDSDRHELIILPATLRGPALERRSVESYSKLWADIDGYNELMGVERRGGHLEYFLEAFADELDQFVAEFEPVPDQIGAVILIDGRVVGLERAPTTAYFSAIWEPMVRVCYGSLAIEARRERGDDVPPDSRVPMRLEDLETLDDLADELERAERRQEEIARRTVDAILDTALRADRETERAGLSLDTLAGDRLVGQSVHDAEGAVRYASLWSA
jgi:hypothetical protein